MFIESVIIGLFVGGFRGGRLNNIIDMNIRGWYIVFLSLALSLSPLFLTGIEGNISVLLMFAGMVAMLIVALLNLDKKGVILILIGGLLNVGLMVLYNFKMPVVMEGLDAKGLSTLYEGINNGTIINYVASDGLGWIKYLGKFIVIPKPYPVPRVLSIGDILMSLGVLWMIIGEMAKPSYTNKGKMVQYTYGSRINRW